MKRCNYLFGYSESLSVRCAKPAGHDGAHRSAFEQREPRDKDELTRIMGAVDCDGTLDCAAEFHIHGCFAAGPFDPQELARWAEHYGHPEGWAKKAQQLHAENERLRMSLLTVTEQVESCCSRAGLCIDADRIRAEAQRPMDAPKGLSE
jgi:hypothetical protein